MKDVGDDEIADAVHVDAIGSVEARGGCRSFVARDRFTAVAGYGCDDAGRRVDLADDVIA